MDEQSISTLESESVADVATLNNVPAGRNRSASDVSVFRLSSVKLRNDKVGYFDSPTVGRACDDNCRNFCIVVKYSVILYLCSIIYGRYGGVSSLNSSKTSNPYRLSNTFSAARK